MEDKKQQFIADVRQLARDYKLIMNRAGALLDQDSGEWSALYSTIISNDDLPDAIIPETESDKLATLTNVISNFQTMLQNFAAGIDTNIERVA